MSPIFGRSAPRQGGILPPILGLSTLPEDAILSPIFLEQRTGTNNLVRLSWARQRRARAQFCRASSRGASHCRAT
eukprot:8807654-Pyramimonas_sp.AAC.1